MPQLFADEIVVDRDTVSRVVADLDDQGAVVSCLQ